MVEQKFPLRPDGGRWAGQRLSEVLKALRRHRRLRPAEVAAAMGMPRRSYEHFESGAARLNVERISRFAEVTDTDPFAILSAVAIGSPDFAVRCADNKLMLVLMLELEAFEAAAGEEIARLPPRTLFAAFRRAFALLRQEAQPCQDFAAAWRERQDVPGEETSPEPPPA